jgi:predicted Zn-dependent protease
MRLVVAMAVAGLLTGCGRGDAPPGAPEIDEAERQVGAQQHPQLLAEFGGSYAGPEAAYVKRIGESVAAAAGLEGQCTFTLVNSDVVNAFAVPGCYIYATRGLVGLVNSEAELASVLAHEVGHIVGEHSARQQSRSIWRQIGVAAVGLLTGSERLTQIAGKAAEYFTLRYSRAQEYQSDDLGIAYLAKAGYDPHEAADMLGALGRQEAFMARTRGRDEARSIPEWARTHPLTENRIERAREAARSTGMADNALPEKQAAYLSEVDGMLYGDDPEQGFVQGRRFAHPVMRIGFEAPQGFTLTNSPQAILLEGPDGLRGEFGGGPLPPGGVEEYAAALVQQVAQGVPAEVGPGELLIINGLRAAIVPVLVRGRDGAVQLTVAAYDGPGGGAYHFIMVAPPTEAAAAQVGELLRSFHLLSAAEAASLRPRRIEVVTAGPGDTEASVARRMASDHPVEHFRVLNGRAVGQALKAGERVKVVAFASGR